MCVSLHPRKILGASHCDLYDGGGKGMIPWDNIEDFLKKNLK